jgi:hypothetical protein
MICPAENSWRSRRSAKRKLRLLRWRVFEGINRSFPGAPRCSLLTLTASSNLGKPDHVYASMQAAWNALCTWIRKNHPHLRFFRVVEVHESGYPHIHVLLVNAPYIAQKGLQEQWSSLLGVQYARVDIRALKGRGANRTQHAIRYVTKYLSKLTERVASSGLWARRVRPYSASRGLLAAPSTTSSHWYTSCHIAQREWKDFQVAEWADDNGFEVVRWDVAAGFYELVHSP